MDRMTNQTHDPVEALAIVLHDDQQAREIANQQDAPLWPHAAKSVRDYWLCIAEIAANSLRTQAEQSSAQVEPVVFDKPVHGHWDSEEGAAAATACLGETRQQLTKGDLTDFYLANAQFLADRNDLDLVVWQTAAKERIRWLSAQLAAALQQSSEREAKMTAEIERLKASTLTPNMLADAVECFWNAAIGDACNAQDNTTFSTIGAFATGFAAIANRLREHAQALGGSDEA